MAGFLGVLVDHALVLPVGVVLRLALVQVHRVLLEFRARFVGKASPVHFFWGGADLCTTRFSGRPAPKHPGGVPNCPDWVQELAYWAGGSNSPSATSASPAGRGEGLGLTDEVIPAHPPQTSVPGRDFGHGGTLPVSEEHDKAAVYAILYCDEDSPECWLHGGEALSAMWIEAIERDLTVLPLSAVAEVPQTRQTLRHLLAELGEPLIALRVGVPDPDHAGPPHTPRLPADQTIDID